MIFCKREVRKHVFITNILSKGSCYNEADKHILEKCGITATHRRTKSVQQCMWRPPDPGIIKISCDGATHGNPGQAGIGFVFRDDQCRLIRLVLMKGISIEDNYMADCRAVVDGVVEAINKDWFDLWVETDSTATVTAFRTNQEPWRLYAKWRAARKKLNSFHISHIWREGNFFADTASKRGALLCDGDAELYDQRPSWLTKWEAPLALYFRFDK
ncbi:Ribonuclease h domain [Thalictrum thalictroides]|uniref:Ribonuclease h domain n=1 Tax=Thalictrum thalictroides TaxID=46969 RepID=A0A7J6V8S9_THATH|nr:Ribonuclease h domain [Thalictrum thalictroides]